MRNELIDLITIGIARACVKEANGEMVDQAAEIADVLLENDYRKSSDVAEEIFREIEDAHEECIHIDPTTNIGYLLQTKFVHKLAELKKKYTEDNDNA